MAGAIRLAIRRALVAVGLHEVVGLLLEKRVDRVLDRSSGKLPEFLAPGVLVECYDGVRHGPAA